jgi:hypothetical protein
VIRTLDVAEPLPVAAEADRDVPLLAPTVRAPSPPLAAGVVSGVAVEVVGVVEVVEVVDVVDVVDVSHVWTGGVVATVVVVVDVDVDVVVVVEVVSTGAVSTGEVSTGVVSTTVVVEVVVDGGVVVDGAVGVAQSSTRRPEDNALALVEPFVCRLLAGTDVGVEADADEDVDAEADGAVLELV